MSWIKILIFLLKFQLFSFDHVTFFGRYACNVDFEVEYCTTDTYIALAFYYGLLDGGGVTKNGTFIGSDITVEFFDPSVEGKFSMGNENGEYTSSLLDIMLKENKTDPLLAVVGVENDCKQVAALAQAYDIPSLLVNCVDQVGESHMPSNKVIEMSTTQGEKYRAFAKIAKSIGWTNLAVINFVDDGADDFTYHSQLLDALSEQSITLDYVKKGGFSATLGAAIYTGVESIADVIMESYLKTRIYVLIMSSGAPGQLFLHVLSTMGLLETGKFFVIMMGPIDFDKSNYFSFNANRGGTYLGQIPFGISDADVRRYYRSILYLTDIPHYPKNFSYEWINFQNRVKNDADRTFCPPMCNSVVANIAQNDPWSDDAYWDSEDPAIINSYDVGRLLSDVVSVHGSAILRNSTQLVDIMASRRITSLLGFVSKFNENRVSQREYILWAPQESSSGVGPIALTQWAKVAATILPDGNGAYLIKWNNLTDLGIMNGKLPSSRPVCGFNDELCGFPIRSMSELGIIIIAVCGTASLILIIVSVYFLRLIAYERRLESSYFLIDRKEVDLIDLTRFGSSRAGNMLQSVMSLKSMHNDMMPDAGGTTMQYYHQGIRRAAKREKQKAKMTEGPGNKESWLDIYDWHLARFDNTLVTVRKINKQQLKLTREMKQEIDILMTESHENLNRFFGLINETELIFTVHGYGPRKSLNDLLRNDDLRIDRMFRVSFVDDVSKGLHFLHTASKIGYHGNLKSTNCLVDAYWRVKLSNFGMETIRQDEPESKADDLLWTSPELIRRFNVKHDLTKAEIGRADVYSFSIVLYEVYGRQGPYGDDFLDSEEIIEQIKFPEGGSLTRPDIHLISKSPFPITEIVTKCWSEDPMDRPTIKKIRDLLKPLTKGMKGNIADNIMTLLDKYKNNLEDVIKERTEQVDEEKTRNENLLLQLLPKSVAINLKNGKPVDAEFFESVSIYFSDIVGFTSLSSKSSPEQVVTMLNSLYTVFDSIIDQYDCYKVETIGDAYMFVSGLPELNGHLHAGEVASASFELLRCIEAFVVTHCPEEKLRLRIGNHSGSVISGVVGIRMPRYCLFGESVIIANGMESSGEPMKIQMSSDTYELILKCGGYEVQPRGKITLKNKIEVTTYWLNGYSREARLARLMEYKNTYPQLGILVQKAITKKKKQ